eukprot:675943-Prymnesium_polylepis.1
MGNSKLAAIIWMVERMRAPVVAPPREPTPAAVARACSPPTIMATIAGCIGNSWTPSVRAKASMKTSSLLTSISTSA